MKRSALRAASVFAVVLALCLALVGCGASGEGGTGAHEANANFVGTWAIDSMSSDGQEMTEDELSIAKAMGVYLTLRDDGTAALELFGVEAEGTWEATDASHAMLRIEEGSSADVAGDQEMTFADGTLTMESPAQKMVFTQIDPSEKTSADLEQLLGTDLEEFGHTAGGSMGSTTSAVSNAQLADSAALDIVVADDDMCTIKVTAKGDYFGDPGYYVEVVNKTDGQIFVDDNNEFGINGTVASPVFSMTVNAGETGSAILWFDKEDINGAGVEALSNVNGKLTVTNETGDVLRTYDFVA